MKNVSLGQQIVEPDAAADEDLLDARQLAELPQQGQVIRMVGDQVFAGGREQALSCRARAALQLLFAGGLAEVRCRAADVMDVALEARCMRHALGFPEDRLLRAGLDDPALMERQRTEAARAEAAPAGGQAEFDLRAKIQNDGGFPSGDYARGYFVIPNEYTVNQRNYTAIINRVLTDQKNVECVTLRALKTAIAKKEAMRSGE